MDIYGLKSGDKILVSTEAVILRVAHGHGVCFEVELPKRDYQSPRTVWVNPEEIAEAVKDFEIVN